MIRDYITFQGKWIKSTNVMMVVSELESFVYQCFIDIKVLLLNAPFRKVPLVLSKDHKVMFGVPLVQAVASRHHVKVVDQSAPAKGRPRRELLAEERLHFVQRCQPGELMGLRSLP